MIGRAGRLLSEGTATRSRARRCAIVVVTAFFLAGAVVAGFYVFGARFFSRAAPAAPRKYWATVAPGGAVEAKYLAPGAYKTRFLAVAAPEPLGAFSIFYPAELMRSARRRPVVIYANGSGVVAEQCRSVLRRLASHGFIVITSDVPGSCLGTPTNQTLDYLLQCDEDPASIFYRKIDKDRIGAVGHSLGGVGVMNAVTERDHARFYRCAVLLSPAAIRESDPETGRETYRGFDKIAIPTALFLGTERDVLTSESATALFEELASDKVMATRVGADHYATLYSEDGYVTAWLCWLLLDDDEAAKAFVGGCAEILTNRRYRRQSIELKAR